MPLFVGKVTLAKGFCAEVEREGIVNISVPFVFHTKYCAASTQGRRMKNLILTLGLLLCASLSRAQSHQEDLNALYALFNQRFDSQGKYHADQHKAEEFIKAQEAFAEKMKAQGALQEVLFVENSFERNLWVRLFVLQSESQHLLTLYWEQGRYQDQEVRSFLRFRPLSSLESGLKFVPVMNTYAFVMKGFYMKPESGGSLQLIYASDIRREQFAAENLFLVKSGSGWILQTEKQHQTIHQAWIDIWVQYLPPNGGIRSIRLQ